MQQTYYVASNMQNFHNSRTLAPQNKNDSTVILILSILCSVIKWDTDLIVKAPDNANPVSTSTEKEAARSMEKFQGNTQAEDKESPGHSDSQPETSPGHSESQPENDSSINSTLSGKELSCKSGAERLLV